MYKPHGSTDIAFWVQCIFQAWPNTSLWPAAPVTREPQLLCNIYTQGIVCVHVYAVWRVQCPSNMAKCYRAGRGWHSGCGSVFWWSLSRWKRHKAARRPSEASPASRGTASDSAKKSVPCVKKWWATSDMLTSKEGFSPDESKLQESVSCLGYAIPRRKLVKMSVRFVLSFLCLVRLGYHYGTLVPWDMFEKGFFLSGISYSTTIKALFTFLIYFF